MQDSLLMKQLAALVVIVICALPGFRLAGALFDSAANEACGGYAAEYQLTLEEATGFLAWRRGSRTEFNCQFRSANGEMTFISESDGQINKTWRYWWLRLGGWAFATGSLVVGVAFSGMAGLLRTDD
jgi:hypothetical protein